MKDCGTRSCNLVRYPDYVMRHLSL